MCICIYCCVCIEIFEGSFAQATYVIPFNSLVTVSFSFNRLYLTINSMIGQLHRQLISRHRVKPSVQGGKWEQIASWRKAWHDEDGGRSRLTNVKRFWRKAWWQINEMCHWTYNWHLSGHKCHHGSKQRPFCDRAPFAPTFSVDTNYSTNKSKHFVYIISTTVKINMISELL